ncbi:hypothetical protein [Burkholderia vietnamiensis]|uniref:hypothetical protein n=1 Tax=Burkholderia vietnamiensis TaxID=60552 RepID=UPI00075A6045|nr:hypothetical protein [Burkholderia vietnamiensis]KVR88597.1 hypothetical protein WK26_29720 [Burkholderia vietnamiensis]KVS23433.1 hypothetical protein WK35_17975 [Burkholderia vietnamiensis]
MADGQPDKNVLGTGSGMLTPTGYKDRPKVAINICDKHVTPAANSILGTCRFYYRPLHGEYWETVEKVSMSSAWETVKKFATSWDPWKDTKVARELLHRREKLIEDESTDSDWSRHGNFMMRHVGCGHKPPGYYVSYGYYYCSNYGAKLAPRLSDKGKAWLASARWFLQHYMEKGLQQNMRGDDISISGKKPNSGTCAMTVPQYSLELDDYNFTTFAFKTHPLAYLDGGLAGLGLPDMVKILGEPNIQEWGDSRTLYQAYDSGLGVGKQYVDNSVDFAKKAGNAVNEGVVDPVARALEKLMSK